MRQFQETGVPTVKELGMRAEAMRKPAPSVSLAVKEKMEQAGLETKGFAVIPTFPKEQDKMTTFVDVDALRREQLIYETFIPEKVREQEDVIRRTTYGYPVREKEREGYTTGIPALDYALGEKKKREWEITGEVYPTFLTEEEKKRMRGVGGFTFATTTEAQRLAQLSRERYGRSIVSVQRRAEELQRESTRLNKEIDKFNKRVEKNPARTEKEYEKQQEEYENLLRKQQEVDKKITNIYSQYGALQYSSIKTKPAAEYAARIDVLEEKAPKVAEFLISKKYPEFIAKPMREVKIPIIEATGKEILTAELFERGRALKAYPAKTFGTYAGFGVLGMAFAGGLPAVPKVVGRIARRVVGEKVVKVATEAFPYAATGTILGFYGASTYPRLATVPAGLERAKALARIQVTEVEPMVIGGLIGSKVGKVPTKITGLMKSEPAYQLKLPKELKIKPRKFKDIIEMRGTIKDISRKKAVDGYRLLEKLKKERAIQQGKTLPQRFIRLKKKVTIPIKKKYEDILFKVEAKTYPTKLRLAYKVAKGKVMLRRGVSRVTKPILKVTDKSVVRLKDIYAQGKKPYIDVRESLRLLEKKGVEKVARAKTSLDIFGKKMTSPVSKVKTSTKDSLTKLGRDIRLSKYFTKKTIKIKYGNKWLSTKYKIRSLKEFPKVITKKAMKFPKKVVSKTVTPVRKKVSLIKGEMKIKKSIKKGYFKDLYKPRKKLSGAARRALKRERLLDVERARELRLQELRKTPIEKMKPQDREFVLGQIRARLRTKPELYRKLEVWDFEKGKKITYNIPKKKVEISLEKAPKLEPIQKLALKRFKETQLKPKVTPPKPIVKPPKKILRFDDIFKPEPTKAKRFIKTGRGLLLQLEKPKVKVLEKAAKIKIEQPTNIRDMVISPEKFREILWTKPVLKIPDYQKKKFMLGLFPFEKEEEAQRARLRQKAFETQALKQPQLEAIVPSQKMIQPQAFGQPQSFVQPQLLAQVQFLAQPQVLKQPQVMKPIVAVVTPVVKISETEKKRRQRIKRELVRGFATLVKRRGKFFQFGRVTTRGEAIRKGERYVRATLGATFKIIPRGHVYRVGRDYKPSPKVFREYKIRRGRKIPLEETWIQKAKHRLSSPSEVREIQFARKSRKTKRKRRFSWL
jgi:hypothetical protein